MKSAAGCAAGDTLGRASRRPVRHRVGILSAVLRKELLALLRDGRLISLAVAALVVMAGFFANAVHEHGRLRAERQAVGTTVQQQWNQQGVKNPHSAAICTAVNPALAKRATATPSFIFFLSQLTPKHHVHQTLPQRFASRLRGRHIGILSAGRLGADRPDHTRRERSQSE